MILINVKSISSVLAVVAAVANATAGTVGARLCECNKPGQAARRRPALQNATPQPPRAEVNGIEQISIFRHVAAHALSRTAHRGRMKSKRHLIRLIIIIMRNALKLHAHSKSPSSSCRAAMLLRCNEPRVDEEETRLSALAAEIV